MVVSKRCKLCGILDTNNAPILGDYCGKQIPDIIVRICNIELDQNKANGTLICQSCIIQLVHTDLVVEKIRNSVIRLRKTVKVSRAKSSSTIKKNSVDENSEQLDKTFEGDPQSSENLADNKEAKPKAAKKVAVRRKSVFPGEKTLNAIEGNTQNGETPKPKFKKLMDDENNTNAADLTTTPTKDNKDISDSVQKVAKKVATKKKSVLPDNNSLDANEVQNEETPKTKFIKLMDSEAIIAEENKTPTNLSMLHDDDVENTSLLKNNVANKRNKGMSDTMDEECIMDLTMEGQNGTISTNDETSIYDITTKVLNCVICGKKYHSKSILRDHIENEHAGESLKACPFCSIEFRSQQKYESHVFNEKCKKANYACQYLNCNKRFKSAHKMELHMQDKHLSLNALDTE